MVSLFPNHKIKDKRECPYSTISGARIQRADSGILEQTPLGVPGKYIMERGGWDSAAMLQGIYQRTFTEKMKGVGDLADQQYQKTESPVVSDKK